MLLFEYTTASVQLEFVMEPGEGPCKEDMMQVLILVTRQCYGTLILSPVHIPIGLQNCSISFCWEST